METSQIVALLVAERDRLNRAIEALQGPTKRRGRPPKNPTFNYNHPSVPDGVKPASAKNTRSPKAHYERRWPEGDSGRSKKKMGVDTGRQSGFAVCEAEGEVETEGSKQVQEDGQGSITADAESSDDLLLLL